MKTAVIFDLNPEEIIYLVAEGDYSDCHGHYVNGSENEGIVEKIVEHLYKDENKTDIEGFKQAILEGALLIQCGFYL